MSAIRLIQQIRDKSKALEQARNAEDWDTVDELEDELEELNAQLEDEQNSEYDDRHNKSWQ